MATKTPLKIALLPPVNEWDDEIKELMAAGHVILCDDVNVNDADLIVGRAAWHMDTAHRGMLAKAVQAAQARVKGRKK